MKFLLLKYNVHIMSKIDFPYKKLDNDFEILVLQIIESLNEFQNEIENKPKEKLIENIKTQFKQMRVFS